MQHLGELVPEGRLAVAVADRDAHLERLGEERRRARGRSPAIRSTRASPLAAATRAAGSPSRAARSKLGAQLRPCGGEIVPPGRQQARDRAGVGERGVVARPLGQRDGLVGQAARPARCRPAGGR